MQAGVLVATSPSAIEAWDETTPFGCQRRWWFQYVAGLPQPASPSQALGTALHSLIEDELGAQPTRSASAEAARLFLAVKPTVHDVMREGVVSVEDKITLELDGVTVNGRIDVRKSAGILDWKTSSDVARYAKTPGQLRKSTQMVLYALWLSQQPGSTYPIEVEHVYVQTKGRPLVERVKAKLDRGSLDKGVAAITVLIGEMKIAAAKQVSELKADRSKCRQCPYNQQCPKENTTMASLLSRFASASTSSTEPAPVLPPDAPASDSTRAAQPVVGFSAEIEATPTAPSPEAPKKRGRPAGARTRPKILDLSGGDDISQSPVASPPPAVVLSAPLPPAVATVATVEYQMVTIAYGATIPTQQFANQRLDITLSARFSGDVDAAAAEVSTKVRTLVVRELEKISLSLSGPVLKP